MVKNFFLHKAPSKRLFWNGMHSLLLRRAYAKGSAGIIYRIYVTHIAALRVRYCWWRHKV